MNRCLVFVCVTPAPYQRDVFLAIAGRHRAGLRVHYMESAPHDTPWKLPSLMPCESLLPGRTFLWQGGRSHFNWGLPSPRSGEFWVVNGSMTNVTTQMLMRRLGKRTPWAFWGEMPSTPASRFRQWLQRRQYRPLRHARFIAAVGNRALEAYRRMLPEVPLHNLPYVCDLSAFAAARRPRGPGAETTFLFCGQMIARKGIDLLLNAFARLLQQGLPLRLLLVGREAGLPRLLASLPAAALEKIEYAGFQAPEHLPGLFARADVFVLPSRYDGWGVVVNQALGAGLPCIVSRAAGAAELIKDGVNGRVVPANDEHALADAMRELAGNTALRERLAAGAAASAADLCPERSAQFWEQAAAGDIPS